MHCRVGRSLAMRAMLAMGAATLGAQAAHAAGFLAGFGAEEGYILGPIGGQQGWVGDAVRPSDSTIVNSVYFPSPALQIEADGAFDGFFHLGAASPVFVAPAGSLVTARQRIVIDAAGGPDFLVQTVDAAANRPAVQVQFGSAGAIYINGTLASTPWVPGAVFELAVQHDLGSRTASVLLNESLIASALPLTDVSAITQVQFGTDDALADIPVRMLVDDIEVIPEPTGAVLGWAAALVLARRRRRR